MGRQSAIRNLIGNVASQGLTLAARSAIMVPMTYAVVELGGRQWKVEPGTRLDVNRLPVAVGAEQTVEQVLFASDGQQVHVGRPYVSGARIVCEVLEHRLGPKVISYKYRRRENWRKTVGHRQPLTRLLVKDVVVGGEAVAAPAAAKAPVAKAIRAKVKAPKAIGRGSAKAASRPASAGKPRTPSKSGQREHLDGP